METSPSRVRVREFQRGLRKDQKKYLDQHREEVLADLFGDTPYELVARKYQVNSKYLEESMALWLNDPGFRYINPLPKPPDIQVGEEYDMSGLVAEYRCSRGSRGLEIRKMKYLGTIKSRAPGNVIYMFRSRGGYTESFTIFQLRESFNGGTHGKSN